MIDEIDVIPIYSVKMYLRERELCFLRNKLYNIILLSYCISINYIDFNETSVIYDIYVIYKLNLEKVFLCMNNLLYSISGKDYIQRNRINDSYRIQQIKAKHRQKSDN